MSSTKKCIRCNAQFKPGRSDQKYCSSLCRHYAHRARTGNNYTTIKTKSLGALPNVLPGELTEIPGFHPFHVQPITGTSPGAQPTRIPDLSNSDQYNMYLECLRLRTEIELMKKDAQQKEEKRALEDRIKELAKESESERGLNGIGKRVFSDPKLVYSLLDGLNLLFAPFIKKNPSEGEKAP